MKNPMRLIKALAVSVTVIGSMPIITAKASPVAMPCSGTGLTNCQIAFRESKGDWLLVQTEAERSATTGQVTQLDPTVNRAQTVISSEHAQLLASRVEKVRDVHAKGFVFTSQDIRHATNPSRSVRIGEKISPQSLKKRFTGYGVRYLKGEDCLTCAVIFGADGQFEVSFAQDGRTIVDIRSRDDRSRDTQGNAVGASLAKAIGSTSAQCDAGMDTTCASPNLKGLSYIVADDDRCQITVKEKKPAEIPACARIAGFQILTIESGAQPQEDYALLCKNRILQSSDSGVKLGRLNSPVIFHVRFTVNETTWIDPRDKSEKVFENLLLTQGDSVNYGGQVKGSTYDSSTTFDGAFKTTGKGTINWGYAKPLQAFILTTGTQTYLCEMKPNGRK